MHSAAGHITSRTNRRCAADYLAARLSPWLSIVDTILLMMTQPQPRQIERIGRGPTASRPKSTLGSLSLKVDQVF